jgi:hypothetical protein
MRLDTLWIVTIPTSRSILVDICFGVSYLGLYRQFKGGLEPEQIFGMYTDRKEAEDTAKDLLRLRDASEKVKADG